MKREYPIQQLFKMGWEQLTPKEMITIIELSDRILDVEKDSVDYGFILIAMLRIIRKNKSAVSKINEAQAVDCFNNVTFFQRNEDRSFKTPWLFFPIGNFTAGGETFERPQLLGTLPMYNRTFDHLVYCDQAFSAFCLFNYQLNKEHIPARRDQLQSDMNDALDSLIAVLYHSQFNFDVKRIEVTSRLIRQKLTIAERSLILHTYANVRQFITEKYPYLFPAPLPSNEQSESAPQLTGAMWLNLRFDLAETEVFKGFDTARNALIYDALNYLEKKAKEAYEAKPKDIN